MLRREPRRPAEHQLAARETRTPSTLEGCEDAPDGVGRSWYYEAEGSWNLLGTDENAPREEHSAQDSAEGRLRMVAGGGFEPPTFGL